MKKTKQGFIDWNYNILISSLKKINLNIFLIIILDILFYLSSGYAAIFWLTRINEKAQSFDLPNDLGAIGFERAQQLSQATQSFLYIAIFSFVLLLIAIIFLSSILKGIIWGKTTNTKISFNLISKFLGLNLIWLGAWLVVIFLISWLVEVRYARLFMFGSILIGFYFTNTMYALFMQNQKLKSITSSIRLNITKIHLFLLPYFIVFAGFYLAIFLSSLVRLDQFSIYAVQKIYEFAGLNFAAAGVLSTAALSPQSAISSLTGLLANPLFLLFAALARYYVSTLVMELNKGKQKDL